MRIAPSGILLASLLMAGTVATAPPILAAGPSLYERVHQTLQKMEIKPQPQKPDWAKLDSPTLFTFVWMSDFHLDGSRFELLKQAFRYVDEDLDAHFVIITGDNNAHVPKHEGQGPVPPVTLRRQLFMQRYLNEHLRTPYVILPGDNWPQDFEKVFGSFQFSFNCGGLHFLCTALDRCTYGVEGRAVFDEATWEWMREDLKRHHDRPSLFVMHETIAPPSFLDAGKTQTMLEKNANVIASFCGHVHTDVQFTMGRLKYLACPSLGCNPRHGFKIVTVHREALILRTAEYNSGKERYEKVMKWQRVDIPESLQGSLHAPKDGKFEKQDYSQRPPHPRKSDPTLVNRTMEMVLPLFRFLAGNAIP